MATMDTTGRTVVTFQIDSFNTSEPKDYFIYFRGLFT